MVKYSVLNGVVFHKQVTDTLINMFGGCTEVKKGRYQYNYDIPDNQDLIVKPINDIKLILPPETTQDRLKGITKVIQILGCKPLITRNKGFWNGSDGIASEDNYLISFISPLSDIRLNFFLHLMEDIKFEYKQEATAMMVNDSLILI